MPRRFSLRGWIYPILMIYILLIGAYLRITGIFWGEYQYLHPDERFLIWVGTDISPVKSLSEYWNTAISSLNPHNRGHGFYVYGTLPMFITRYLVEWIYGHSGFQEMTNVGRVLSALFDLATVLLVYWVGTTLFDRRVGVLASAFSSFAVLQIQHAHFFTMDTFTTFFTMLGVYFAVRLETTKPGNLLTTYENDRFEKDLPSESGNKGGYTLRNTEGFKVSSLTSELGKRGEFSRFIAHPYFSLCLGFGMALGMATASKINAAPLAFFLPLVFVPHYMDLTERDRRKFSQYALFYLVVAGLIALLVFRIFQPYAFSGPGFFGLRLNPAWLENLRELQRQSSGDVDFPPAIQWTRRPVWFAWQNIVLWGMGLPLGLLAWLGFLWAGWRMWKGEWRRFLFLWFWTGFYFTWQSLIGNPSMRYQLLIYPTLALFAAWGVFYLYDQRVRIGQTSLLQTKWLDWAARVNWARISAILVGGSVLVATALYAISFVGIYQRPITRVEASRWIYQNIPGPINLRIQTDSEVYNQPQAVPTDFAIRPDMPLIFSFKPRKSGDLYEIYFPNIINLEGQRQTGQLVITISKQPDFNEDLATVQVSVDLPAKTQKKQGYLAVLDQAIPLVREETYYLSVQWHSENGAIALRGTTIANEGAWDDPLPLRTDGYDGFGGIYEGLNFDMYDDDTPEKLTRFLDILDRTEYIIISSSRQWGSLPRLPERYPMSLEYYRHLIGCPPNRSIEWCYSVALPGRFQEDLGFDLIQVFHSSPRLGSLVINDQFAEEAFTVYDHPKVFIFKKREDYNPERVREVLASVDLSQVIHVTPKEAESLPPNMMLPLDRLAEQQSGGTWSELFKTEALHNRYPILSLILWYIVLLLLGWITYPIIRPVMSGLNDRGYPLSRIAGLLLSSYLVWMAGSFRIPFQRSTITLVLGLMSGFGVYLAIRQRNELRHELRERRSYFIVAEILFLLFFFADILIRLGNPDLWHPWKGGEKPMDFSYFNAVLKSTSFPPYDPWFAGGYINYYYYGFVFVGVLVKWLGIVPSIAFNLIIPSIFAMIALGAFSVGWNLTWVIQHHLNHSSFRCMTSVLKEPTFISGIASMLSMAVLGNLGTLRMIFQGYQRLAAPGGSIDGVSVFTHWIWAIRGFIRAILGTPLPFGLADWYWNPSRAIPAPNDVEPITEFPFFTVLYADPHAHLFAMPLALLALSWALSLVISRGWQVDSVDLKSWIARLGYGLLFGALSVGVLRPTNTWDFPTYLLVGTVGLGYTLLRYPIHLPRKSWVERMEGLHKTFLPIGAVILFIILSLMLFQPYTQWYVQGYTAVDFWKGTRTPFWSYMTHWGLFLFILLFWLGLETYEWMARTPLSVLRKIEPYKSMVAIGFVIVLLFIVALSLWGVHVAWLVLLLAIWTGLLALQGNISDAKRLIFALVTIALLLTLMVEVIVLRGDIGRMNTVFKFYLQSWTLFAVSVGPALACIVYALPKWHPTLRSIFRFGLTMLVASAALYPLLATPAKIKDRMTPNAPHTLDGMTFMKYSTYNDLNTLMDLSEDYRAIRWMQENIKGSPVIIEANMVEYHWGTRFTIYTGLPNVVGWNWHQRQQRASRMEGLVQTRVNEVNEFYLTTDMDRVKELILKYKVRYIIVGQLERAYYPGPGLEKFEQYDGVLWRSVYRDGNTFIYEVTYPE